MDAGKAATSKSTDPGAKSYSSVVNSNLTLAFKGELNAIANQNASLERKLDKNSNKLLKEFRKMATCQEVKTKNEIKTQLKDFRIKHNEDLFRKSKSQVKSKS